MSSQVVPSVSISYVVYEHTKRWYVQNPLACPLLIDFSGLLFSYLTNTTSIGFLQYFFNNYSSCFIHRAFKIHWKTRTSLKTVATTFQTNYQQKGGYTIKRAQGHHEPCWIVLICKCNARKKHQLMEAFEEMRLGG